jgi:integrase
MAKLTDIQLIVLSVAAGRDDGIAVVPAKMNRARLRKLERITRGPTTVSLAASRRHRARSRCVIRRYRESSAWASLAVAMRDQRENIYRNVEKPAGDVPFTAITRVKIIEGREKRKATPHQANNFIKSMRGLFRWAVDVEIAKVDPTRDVKLLNVRTDGFHVWTDDEVARFEARWPVGTRESLAFDLLLYTGLRRGDAVLATLIFGARSRVPETSCWPHELTAALLVYLSNHVHRSES